MNNNQDQNLNYMLENITPTFAIKINTIEVVATIQKEKMKKMKKALAMLPRAKRRDVRSVEEVIRIQNAIENIKTNVKNSNDTNRF